MRYRSTACVRIDASAARSSCTSFAADAKQAIERYLTLLRAGGSDYPMQLLARAGVDLREPDTVRAVAVELDGLVTRLEADLQ